MKKFIEIHWVAYLVFWFGIGYIIGYHLVK